MTQKKVRNVVNECQIIIHKDERWKYINMNPTPPTIRGMLKNTQSKSTHPTGHKLEECPRL